MTDSVSQELVEAFYAAYARHDTGKLADLLHDDVEWTISGPVAVLTYCGRRSGKAAVIDLVGRLIPSLFHVVSFMRDSIVVDGGRVATLNRLSARRCSDGRVISYRLANFICFRDGKVIESVSLIDSFDAVEQMLGHSLHVHEGQLADTGNLVAV